MWALKDYLLLSGILLISALVAVGATYTGAVLGDPAGIGDFLKLFGSTLLGGAIATTSTLMISRASQQRVQKAQTIAVLFKSSVIFTDALAIRDSIYASLEGANEAGLTNQPLWKRISGTVGLMKATQLNYEELMPLVEAREYDLVQDFISIVTLHDILNQGISHYMELRDQVKRLLPSTVHIGGNALASAVPPDIQAKLAPYEVELETLIVSIRSQNERLVELSRSVTHRIGPAGKRIFGRFTFIDVDVVRKVA